MFQLIKRLKTIRQAALSMTARQISLAILLTTMFVTARPVEGQPGRSTFSGNPIQRSDPLADYLRDLQLNELLAAQLELQYDGSSDDRERELLGRELVDLYSNRIQEGDLSDEDLAQALQKLDRILLSSPQLKTAELEILLLQAEYQRAFLDLNQWMEKRDDLEARQRAVDVFIKLAPRFESAIGELQGEVDALQARIDREEREAQVDALFEEQSEFKSALLRASYFAAWNDYYLGIGLTDESARSTAFERARERFADFLRFDRELDYELTDAESLELELPLRARAGLGMTVTEFLTGNVDESRQWLNWLGDPRVDADIRDDRYGEFILALLLCDRFDEAISEARTIVRDLAPPGRLPTVRLSRTLARYGEYAVAAGVGQGETLRALGYEGLVRQRQFQLAIDLMSEFESEAPAASNFYLGWLDGYRLFRAAEETKATEDFALAAERLKEVEGLPGAKSSLQLHGYFQMQLAWSLYQSNKYEEAIEHFDEVVPLLKEADRNVAVDAAWMRALSLQQIAKTNPEKTRDAIDAFQKLALEFADHPKASEAKYQIGRLQRQAGTSVNPVASLEKVKSDDKNYLLARYEICLVRFDQWKSTKEVDAKTEIYNQLIDDVDLFCRLGRLEEQAERRLRCRLVTVEAAFGQKDNEQADRQLDAAQNLADQRPATDPLVAQYHYWRLMQARRDSQPGRIIVEARWLVERAQASTFRQAGLVYLTQQLEATFATSRPDRKQELSAELVELYRQLVQLLGDDPGTLIKSKNARVASFKLGWHHYQLGNMTDAQRQFGRLLEALPDNESYLKWGGLAASKSNNHEAAVAYWTRLLKGLDSGSEPWFEARYYELDSLRQLDLPRAQKIWKQFKLLHPEIPFADWRKRYDELGPKLGG